MLGINETIICYDPAEALNAESGVFEGLSPSGERFQFVCRPGRSITNVRYTPEHHNEGKREWLLKKVAELRSEQGRIT
jgi:hypothetical protein